MNRLDTERCNTGWRFSLILRLCCLGNANAVKYAEGQVLPDLDHPAQSTARAVTFHFSWSWPVG